MKQCLSILMDVKWGENTPKTETAHCVCYVGLLGTQSHFVCQLNNHAATFLEVTELIMVANSGPCNTEN